MEYFHIRSVESTNSEEVQSHKSSEEGGNISEDFITAVNVQRRIVLCDLISNSSNLSC